MNTLSTMRIAVACAAACCAGFAWADSQPDQQTSSPQASQDEGGVPSTTSASGAPMAISRDQVYQDLVRSEKNGDFDRLQLSLYHGQ